MADSSLVKKFMQAYGGNYTPNRSAQGGKIKKITIHHFASTIGLDALGNLWQTPGRVGSSHYGVKDGSVCQYVAEKDVAYTDSSWSSNINSVTIETSNSGGAPNWPISDASFETLAKLCADIARRNGLGTLVKGQNLTWHQMYVATACPGPYLLGKMDALVKRANEINQTTPGGNTVKKIGIYAPINNTASSKALWDGAPAQKQPDGTMKLHTRRMVREVTEQTVSSVFEKFAHDEAQSWEIIAVTDD